MDTTETDMKEMWRLIGAALLFAVVCAGAALAALRADAQPAAAALTQPAAATATPAAPAATPAPAATAPAPAATAAPAATTPSPAGTAAPEDEIPDDPTVAPDSRQKADNNVSFPVDI